MDFARLVDYRDDYQPGARRFDVGQRTKFELVPMAVAALEQITAWGVPAVAEALARVTDEIVGRTAELGLAADPSRSAHMLGLQVPEHLRDGIVPAIEAAGCFAALRGASLRISPHLHVTGDDVDRLIDALHAAVVGRR